MKLTQEQEEAIAAADQDLLLIAAAGSGKTLVLTEIAVRLLSEFHVAPEHLVIITFTQKAAAELQERVCQRMGVSSHQLGGATIGTIHHFAARLLRDNPGLRQAPFVIWDQFRAQVERSRCVSHILKQLFAQSTSGFERILAEYGWRRLRSLLLRDLATRWRLQSAMVSSCLPCEGGFTPPELAQGGSGGEVSGAFPPVSNDLPGCEQGSGSASPSEPKGGSGGEVSGAFPPVIWHDYWELYQICLAHYQEHKQRWQALDYEDLEERAVTYASQESLRASLQNHYRHILVDEYQDTSPLQHTLINSLYAPGKNHLIVVGDPYQSIYRFRGARPHLFEAMRAQWAETGKTCKALRSNFRSTPSYIKSLNQLFSSLFGKAYQEMKGMRAGSNEPVLALMLPKKRWLYERRQVEAEAVADWIQQALAGGRSPNEIAVLFRTRAALPFYQEVFRTRGLEIQSETQEPLLKSEAVVEQLHLLRVLMEPADRMAWVGLLSSRLAGFSQAMLWSLREQSFPDVFESETSRFTWVPEERRRWDDFAAWWQELAGRVDSMNASELARWVLTRASSLGFYQSGFGRQDLLHWIDFLQKLEEQDPLSLREIWQLVEELRDEGARITTCHVSDASDQAIQFLTVHAAKGLEFPLVVLADLTAAMTSSRDTILIDDEGGLGQKRRNLEAEGLRDSLYEDEAYQQVKARIEQEDEAELRRLLYVACTRAKESLILPLSPPGKNKRPTWNDWLYEAFSK